MAVLVLGKKSTCCAIAALLPVPRAPALFARPHPARALGGHHRGHLSVYLGEPGQYESVEQHGVDAARRECADGTRLQHHRLSDAAAHDEERDRQNQAEDAAAGDQPAPTAPPAPPAPAPLTPPKPAPPQKSVNFIIDILSDQDGLSIYRFQMAVWTLVLAFFAYEVWWDLTMPTFDPVILGLLGISNGTYVGFKIPNATGGQSNAGTNT